MRTKTTPLLSVLVQNILFPSRMLKTELSMTMEGPFVPPRGGDPDSGDSNLLFHVSPKKTRILLSLEEVSSFERISSRSSHFPDSSALFFPSPVHSRRSRSSPSKNCREGIGWDPPHGGKQESLQPQENMWHLSRIRPDHQCLPLSAGTDGGGREYHHQRHFRFQRSMEPLLRDVREVSTGVPRLKPIGEED